MAPGIAGQVGALPRRRAADKRVLPRGAVAAHDVDPQRVAVDMGTGAAQDGAGGYRLPVPGAVGVVVLDQLLVQAAGEEPQQAVKPHPGHTRAPILADDVNGAGHGSLDVDRSRRGAAVRCDTRRNTVEVRLHLVGVSDAVLELFEVQMGAGGLAGATDAPDLLADDHRLTLTNHPPFVSHPALATVPP